MAATTMPEAKGTPEIPPSLDSGNQKDLERLDVDQPATESSPQQDGSVFKRLSWLDRLLALWILLAMAVGIILGNFVPETGPALQKGDFVGVSVPIGVFYLDPSFPLCMAWTGSLWLFCRDQAHHQMMLAVGLLVMMYPILCKVRYETLHIVFQTRAMWTQIFFSVIVNWIVAPLLMVGFHLI